MPARWPTSASLVRLPAESYSVSYIPHDRKINQSLVPCLNQRAGAHTQRISTPPMSSAFSPNRRKMPLALGARWIAAPSSFLKLERSNTCAFRLLPPHTTVPTRLAGPRGELQSQYAPADGDLWPR